MKPPTGRRGKLERASKAAWLLLVFSLPTKRKSERVEVWRKLKRIGALPLGSSGYLLPHNPQTQEQFEWLASTIRGYKGQASVIQVSGIDDLPPEELATRFNEVRARDYQELLRGLGRMRRRKLPVAAQVARVRQRLKDIAAIDFFDCALRKRVEELLLSVTEGNRETKKRLPVRKSEFHHKTWVTRPRPGIDRVSSAWLIKQFIDPEASFVFSSNADEIPNAIPFDMFEGSGFSHRSDDCTFETLCKEFDLQDPKIDVIAQIVHDADLGDEKFGRREGEALDSVLAGWAAQAIEDLVLLERGMQLFDGLYHSMR